MKYLIKNIEKIPLKVFIFWNAVSCLSTTFPKTKNNFIELYLRNCLNLNKVFQWLMLKDKIRQKPLLEIPRGSRSEVFCKKLLLKISQNSQENTCARVSFLIKLQVLLLKKRLWYRCFPVKFAKFLRTPILWNTSGGCFSTSQYFLNKFHRAGSRSWVIY